jgi:CRISPR-associated endonuclease/helicase Cas3
LNEEGMPPKHWGTDIYHPYLLKATSDLLAARHGGVVQVPGEVQELVEQVHGDGAAFKGRELYPWEVPQLAELKLSHDGEKLAEESIGANVVIPTPAKVLGLEALSRLDMADDEWQAATRLGADSMRVLCCYDHGDRVTLDAEGSLPLPDPEKGEELTVSDVRAVMRRTIAVRADWLKGHGPDHAPPATWADHGLLGNLVVLRQPVRDGQVSGVRVGERVFRLDVELGLVS